MLSHIVPKILSLDNTSQKDATRRKGYTVQSLKEHIILVLLSASLPFLPEHVSRIPFSYFSISISPMRYSLHLYKQKLGKKVDACRES